MTMASRSPSPTFDADDVSPLAAEGNNLTVDDKTIFNTPDPVAASTIGKTGNIRDPRYLDASGGRGSFIESNNIFTPEATGEQKLLPLEMSMDSVQQLSDQDTFISPRDSDDAGKLDVEGSRSSLGLVALDNMEDLSSSIIHFDPTSPQKPMGAAARQRPSVICEETEPETPKMAQLSSANSSYHATDGHPQNPQLEMDAAEADMESMLRKKSKEANRNLFSTGGTSGSQDIAAAFALLGSGGSGGLEQMDSSIHEVELNEDDIQNLDDEFSDIGEFDNTVTNSDDISMRGGVADQPEADAVGEYQSIFAQSAPPPDLASLDQMFHTMPSYDEIDMPKEGSLVMECRNDIVGAGRTEAIENRRLGGEGVESVESDFQGFQVPESLDARYLQPSPHFSDAMGSNDGGMYSSHLPGDGEGEDEAVESERQLRQQGVLSRGQRVRGIGSDSYSASLNSSDIDTDDEVEAVRREMQQRFLQDERDSDLPGLADTGEPNVRQGAEGDVGVSPVPGDGGGGGDGSSGHGSDDDTRPPTAPQMLAQQGPTTFEVLRGLGFLGVGSSGNGQVDEFPESEQQRICPMGEELDGAASSSSSSGERRVRFASSTNAIQERNVSGASIDNAQVEDTSLEEGAVGPDPGQVSMSKFLTPSNPLNDQSQGQQDFDQSLFPDTVQDFSAVDREEENFAASPLNNQDIPNPFDGGASPFAAVNPFQDGPGDLDMQQAFEGSEGFGSQEFNELGADGAFGDDDFMSTDKARNMLDKDEEDFKTENVFIPEEEVESGTHSSLDLPDSWSLHSHMTLSNRPSWLTNTAGSTDTPNPQMRISIGTFMAGRTEVLGSLDDGTDTRPTFGSKIVTPPDNRKPVPLLRQSPPVTSPAPRQSPHAPRLSDVTEKKESNTTSENVNTTTCTSSDDVRGSGVGSDTHDGGSRSSREKIRPSKSPRTRVGSINNNDPTRRDSHSSQSSQGKRTPVPSADGSFTLLDYHTSHRAKRLEQENHREEYSGDEADSENPTPSPLKEPVVNGYGQQHSSPPSAESTLSQSGVLQLSVITKLINTASVNVDSTDLADLIMKMSQSKTSQKKEKKDSQPTDHSAETTTRGSSLSKINEQPQSEVGDNIGRIPADGKSKDSQTYVKSGRISIPDSQIKSKVSASSVKARAHSMTSANIPTVTANKGTRSLSSSTLPPAKTRGKRPNVTEKVPPRTRIPSRERSADREATHRSRIPSLERKTDSGARPTRAVSRGRSSSGQRRSSAGRNTTTSSTNAGESDAGKSKIPLFNQKRSSIESSISSHPPTTAQQRNSRSSQCRTVQCVQERNDRTPSPDKHVTENGFTAMDKDASGTDGRPSDGSSRVEGGSPGWISPRPSSVMSRSQRLDASQLGHFPSNLDINKNDSNRAVTWIDRPSLGSSPSDGRQSIASTARHPIGNQEVRGSSEGGLTPTDDYSSKASTRTSKSRMSSTPKAPVPKFSICDSQESISRISPSPRDQFVPDSADATLWSEKAIGSDEHMKKHFRNPAHMAIQQSTPKVPSRSVPYFEGRQSGSSNDVDGDNKRDGTPSGPAQSGPTPHSVLFPGGQQHVAGQPPSLASTAAIKPTLLTSQSLSATPFAQQYLNSVKAYTTPASHLQNAISETSRVYQPDHAATVQSNIHQDLAAGRARQIPDDEFVALSEQSTSKIELEEVHKNSFSVDAPHEVRMEDICCLGLSTQGSLPIRNPTNRWIDVRLQVVAVTINGDAQDPERVHPFITKEKAIIDPGNTEDVKVIFNPKVAGVYVAHIQLIASPVVNDHHLSSGQIPTMVTLQGIAEQPQVQILTDANQHVMDFGALPWGCQKGLPITLINRGRANVPLRLVISSNKTTWNCFTFEKSTYNDSSYSSSRSRSQVTPLVQSILNLTLPGIGASGHLSTSQVVVYFRAPSRQIDRSIITNHPEEFSGRVEVEVDTPSSLVHLGTIHLCAAVGTASLHAPSDLQLLKIQTSLGNAVTKKIPLRNAGNIPLEVSLEVTHWPDFFEVIPSQLTISPRSQSEVIVKFEPKQSPASRFESLLLMFVEPDGPGYEIQILGEIVAQIPQTLPSYPRHSSEPVLLSNKHYLSWGGVAIGRSRQKNLTLKNNCLYPLKLKLQIRGSSSDFMIQSSFDGDELLSDMREIVLQGEEEFPVHVLFSPSRVAGVEAKLQIRPSQINSKYTIPLSGYGGISKLTVEDLNVGQQKNSYWTSVGSPQKGSKIINKLTIRNTGTRAAFVKTICFQDLGCKKKMIDSRITIQPSEFCVCPNEKQELALVLSPSDRETVLCQDKAAIITVIGLFYGDEVSRQKYRRTVKQRASSSVSLPEGNPVRGVNFCVPFEDEDQVKEGYDIVSVPNNEELFYSSMSKITVSLVGEPPKLSTTSPSKPEINLAKPRLSRSHDPQHGKASWEIIDSEPHGAINHQGTMTRSPPKIVPMSPPVKENQTTVTAAALGSPKYVTEINGQKKITGPLGVGTKDIELWSIRPEQVILIAPDKGADPMLKRVQITNFSDRPMSYELSWPAHCITVTPERGNIQPRSNTIVCISANSVLKKKGVQLPWSGSVHITCDNDVKILRVQIREDYVMDDTIVVDDGDAPAPLLSQPGTPLLALVTPVPKTVSNLKVTKQNVTFPATSVNNTSEYPLELTNISPYPIKWTMSSFAPPYLKGADNTGAIYRLNYAAFWFKKQSGIIPPESTSMVVVCFCPKESGQFSQYWEIRSTTEGKKVPSASHTYKVELTGAGVHASATLCSPVCTNTSLRSTRPDSWSSSGDGLLYVKPSKLKFPSCAMEQSHICKVELKNKDSCQHTVDILSPQSPFRVKHPRVTIKKRHFLRLPVEFCPKKPGYYEGVLVLKTDTQQTLTVPIFGECE